MSGKSHKLVEEFHRVPRVYIYDGFRHWLFEAKGASSAAYDWYLKSLKYSPLHGEFDVYIERPQATRGCGCPR